jgi:hypothetical protein
MYGSNQYSIFNGEDMLKVRFFMNLPNGKP